MMKPKTQMRIGLWGAIAFTVFGVYQFIYHPPSWPVEGLSRIASLTLFVFYIFSIIRRKLTTTQIVFRTWWVLVVILLGILFLGLLVGGKWAQSYFLTVLIIFLCCAIPLGLITLIMWMGLRGLERILAAERELDKTFVKNVTLNELDKSPARNTTLKTDEVNKP